jgi:hypothetical protein
MENSSSYSRTFRIKQHTPLIHFHQPETRLPPDNYRNKDKLPEIQSGATLRATELKPKLDKFLFESTSLTLKDKWKQKKQEKALDYKVKIIHEGPVKTTFVDKSNSPMFFANMGKNAMHKVLSFTDRPINVVFFSFHKDLLDIIELQFTNFLFHKNFGTRQSKGYGSFSIDYQNEIGILPYPYLKFKNNIGPNENSKLLFQAIQYYYQQLRSGINYPKTKRIEVNGRKKTINLESIHYKKSFFFQYINRMGYTWEKRWLKDKIEPLSPTPLPETFARILLGLNDSYTFKGLDSIEEPLENEVYPEFTRRFDIKHKGENGLKISRYKSPITFKPIWIQDEWRIYILTDKENKDIYDETFEVSVKGKKKYFIKTPGKKYILKPNDLIAKYHEYLGRHLVVKVSERNQLKDLVTLEIINP